MSEGRLAGATKRVEKAIRSCSPSILHERMTPFNNFTIKAQEALKRAHDLAIERSHQQITPLHILASLVLQEEGTVETVLEKLNQDVSALADELLEHLDHQH